MQDQLEQKAHLVEQLQQARCGTANVTRTHRCVHVQCIYHNSIIKFIYMTIYLLLYACIGCVSCCREQDQDSHKQETRTFEERIDNFKLQLAKEREKSMKVSSYFGILYR